MTTFGKRSGPGKISQTQVGEKVRDESPVNQTLKAQPCAPNGAEHRIRTRKRMIKAGVISYNDHHFTVPCAVRDMSDLGARLKVSDRALVPDTFILLIELDAIEVDCEIVWRSRNEVGIKFVSDIRTTKQLRVQVVSSSGESNGKSTKQLATS